MAELKPIVIKVDGKELDVAKLSVNEFNNLYSDTAKKLNTLPIGSDEWKNLNSELKTADKAFQQTKDIAETTDSKFKSLKVQIRQTTVALQEAEEKGDMKTFNKLKNDLDDLNDKLEITQLKSMKFTDALATLPGVAGVVGQSFQGLDKAFKLIVANPLLATLGALVGIFTALKESLSRTEEGTQKLAKIGEFLERVMNGIFAIIEPFANALVDFVIGILESKDAMKVLGQVVGVTAGILAGAFNIIKTLTTFVVTNFINAFKTAAGVLQGFGDVIAGVFTFDFGRIKKGVNQVKDTVVTGFNNTVDNVKDTFKDLTKGTVDAFNSAYDAAESSFEKGFKRQTKRSKKAAEDAAAEAEKIKKAKQDEINANEQLQQALDENEEKRRARDENKLKELEKQQAFAEKTYKRERERLLALLALEKEGSNEYKRIKSEILALDTKFVEDSQTLAQKITEAKKEQYDKDLVNYQESVKAKERIREQEFTKERNDLDLQYAKGEMSQLEYNLRTGELNKQQSQKRYENAQTDFNNEMDFQKKKYEQGLIDKDTYNKNTEQLTIAYNEKEFGLRQARDQAIVDQDKALSQAVVETKQFETQALIDLEQMKIDAISTLGGIISSLAGDNKALAITGLLVEQGAAIANVLTNSAQTKSKLLNDKAKYIAMAPMAILDPRYGVASASGLAGVSAGLAMNTIGTVTSLAGIAAAIGSGIAKIAQSGKTEKKESGGPRNYERGGMIKGLRHAQGGTLVEAEDGEAIMTRGAVTMFRPLLSAMNQMGGGTSFNSNLMSRPDMADVASPSESQSAPIFRTYVVSNDLTTEQEKQARLKDLSTL